MIRVEFSTLDLTRTRFAFSPLWETVMGFEVMHHPERHAIHLPWILEAREATADLDCSLLEVFLNNPACDYIPDFLTPPPTKPCPDFAAELQTLRQTNAEVVRQETLKTFAGAPPVAARAWISHPAESLERLAEMTQAFWHKAIQPHWSRFQTVLENDVLDRARVLAMAGSAALFAGLHPRITYQNGILEVQTPHSPEPQQVELANRGLLLMPSVFVWSNLQMIYHGHWQPTLAYTPRGVATLWTDKPPMVAQALELLLGKGRAQVLLCLESPANTLEVAQRLQRSPSSVSAHLGVLHQGGLIQAERRGRFVQYRLTQRGVAMLGLFLA
jgi:DNA-binding transcriptional ArsR family regulator